VVEFTKILERAQLRCAAALRGGCSPVSSENGRMSQKPYYPNTTRLESTPPVVLLAGTVPQGTAGRPILSHQSNGYMSVRTPLPSRGDKNRRSRGPTDTSFQGCRPLSLYPVRTQAGPTLCRREDVMAFMVRQMHWGRAVCRHFPQAATARWAASNGEPRTAVVAAVAHIQ